MAKQADIATPVETHSLGGSSANRIGEMRPGESIHVPMQLRAPRPRAGVQATSPFVRRCLGEIGRGAPNFGVAVDVPCGYGRHSLLLASNGYDVVSIDIDERVLKETKSVMQQPGRIHFVIADFDVGLPIRRESIAVAAVVHVVSQKILRIISDVMARGGYLIYETYGGIGQNYLTLPRPGQFAAELCLDYDLVYYKETIVGPRREAATVKCLACRH